MCCRSSGNLEFSETLYDPSATRNVDSGGMIAAELPHASAISTTRGARHTKFDHVPTAPPWPAAAPLGEPTGRRVRPWPETVSRLRRTRAHGRPSPDWPTSAPAHPEWPAGPYTGADHVRGLASAVTTTLSSPAAQPVAALALVTARRQAKTRSEYLQCPCHASLPASADPRSPIAKAWRPPRTGTMVTHGMPVGGRPTLWKTPPGPWSCEGLFHGHLGEALLVTRGQPHGQLPYAGRIHSEAPRVL